MDERPSREEGHFSWLAGKLRRLAGEDPNYRFGDFAKEVVRRYREATTEPSESPSRVEIRGSSERRRDTSRSSAFGRHSSSGAQGHLFSHGGSASAGSPWGRDRGYSDDSSTMSVSPPTLTYSLTTTPTSRPPVTIDDFWTGFFRSAYDAGSSAVKTGGIIYDDLDSQEPFLYLGIPGLAILDIVLQSIKLTAKKELEIDAMVLGDGLKIKAAKFPRSDPEVRPWFEAIVKAKYELAKVVFSDAEVDYLKHIVLCASTKDEDPSMGAGVCEEKKDKIHRVAGVVQGLATNLTQLSWYKQHFEDVLDTLMIDCSHIARSPEYIEHVEQEELERAMAASLQVT